MQALAMGKDFIAEGCDAVEDVELFQADAMGKRFISEGDDGIRQIQRSQGFAHIERTLAYGIDCAVVQGQPVQFSAILKCLIANLSKRSRQRNACQ